MSIWPEESPPAPVRGCVRCRSLTVALHSAETARNMSKVTDLRVLLRRHFQSDHTTPSGGETEA